MAENSDSRDSDNSWVIAGSEVPHEALGCRVEMSQGGAQNLPWPSRSLQLLLLLPLARDAELLASAEHPAAVTPAATTAPKSLGAGLSVWGRGLAPCVALNRLPHSAGEPPEEVSSSEDDAEGLQQRQLRDSHRAPWGPAERRGAEAAGDGESGLSVNSCLLGVLALLGIGLLTFSGERGLAAAGGWMGLAPVRGVDWLQQPPLDSAGDPQSLHSMSLLLDKLAKENQDIRLMQAELQAQKDELQALLQKRENARLHQALQQAAEAHRSAQAELQVLREQLQGLEQEGAAETPRAAPELPHEEQLLHQELAKQRGLLGSMRRELEGALQRAQGSGGMEQLRVELAGLEQQLAQELQRVESWEQNYSKGRSGEGRGATEPFRPRRQEPPKTDKKEGRWHKRSEAKEERRRQHGDPGEREQDGAKHPKRREQPEPHRRQGPRDTKPAKDQNGQRRAGGGKAALHGPHEHNVFWEPPRLQRYRAPQGCTGVAGCARQEGLELFGAELAPVQKGQFLQLLQGYMAGLGWGQHFAGVAARLDGAFASDGTFAHDRLRFRHFVEDVEELLEELAEQEQGHEEAADDFEDSLGLGVPWTRPGVKASHHQEPLAGGRLFSAARDQLPARGPSACPCSPSCSRWLL
uniref:Uncharacterized protein n=1 Tax=Gopherus agassizii TaxID=38772 RepID=A0A452HDN7_9SAUR